MSTHIHPSIHSFHQFMYPSIHSLIHQTFIYTCLFTQSLIQTNPFIHAFIYPSICPIVHPFIIHHTVIPAYTPLFIQHFVHPSTHPSIGLCLSWFLSFKSDPEKNKWFGPRLRMVVRSNPRTTTRPLLDPSTKQSLLRQHFHSTQNPWWMPVCLSCNCCIFSFWDFNHFPFMKHFFVLQFPQTACKLDLIKL